LGRHKLAQENNRSQHGAAYLRRTLDSQQARCIDLTASRAELVIARGLTAGAFDSTPI
jgi:hypothetical protein